MKPKTCKTCKTKFTPIRFGQTCCSLGCAIKYSAELKIKAEKKKQQHEKKVLREKLKTTSDYMKELQTNINAIVRLIDKGCGCICTGSKNGKANAGHYRSVQSHPTLRFHLDNIHLQSEHSNTYLSGDILRYQKGLRTIYGIKYFEYVENISLIQPIKLTKEELKEKIAISKEIIKELKAKDLTYNAKERMDLRKEYNERLGIYK